MKGVDADASMPRRLGGRRVSREQHRPVSDRE
jgi:hypothetical protein